MKLTRRRANSQRPFAPIENVEIWWDGDDFNLTFKAADIWYELVPENDDDVHDLTSAVETLKANRR